MNQTKSRNLHLVYHKNFLYLFTAYPNNWKLFLVFFFYSVLPLLPLDFTCRCQRFPIELWGTDYICQFKQEINKLRIHGSSTNPVMCLSEQGTELWPACFVLFVDDRTVMFVFLARSSLAYS